MNKDTAETVKFWAPYTAEFEDATSSVEIKAPEEGNKEKRARNQSIARTRAGNVLVYDRGNNYNTGFSLEFKDIVDLERAQLLVFLENIQWASTKICYQDMYGDIYIVRCVQDSGIQYEDLGADVKRGTSRIRWNFSLELLNLTDNVAELAIADGPVSNALTLHINDPTDPHNPEVCQEIDAADGNVVLEQFNVIDWNTVIWTVVARKAGISATYIVSGTHNRTTIEDDADEVETQSLLLIEKGDVTSHVVLTVVLSGTGSLQKMQLKCDVDSDGWEVCVRRTKMGEGLQP